MGELAVQKKQNNFASYKLAFLSPIPTLCKTMAFTATKLLTIKVGPKLFFFLFFSFFEPACFSEFVFKVRNKEF